jgi:hypothetical protein
MGDTGAVEYLEQQTASGPAATGEPRSPYVRLGEHDNVVVLTRAVEAGESFAGTAHETWTMSAHLDVGNKLAAAPIAAGERVVKLGMPIGTATQAVEPGAHVHSHNLRSDYIPTDGAQAANGNGPAH